MIINFLDTETSGCNPNTIVQLSMITVNGPDVLVYDHFIDQPDITQRNTNITGITRNDIWKYGIPEKDVAIHLKSLMIHRPMMVAHNVQFDLSMIFDLLKRNLGYEIAYELVSNCKWIDTLTIAKDRWAYCSNMTHKLKDCIKRYNLTDVINSHNALDDTKALFAVFKALADERNDISKYANVIGYNPNYPINDAYKFGFITYKPQPNNRGFVDANEILPLI